MPSGNLARKGLGMDIMRRLRCDGRFYPLYSLGWAGTLGVAIAIGTQAAADIPAYARFEEMTKLELDALSSTCVTKELVPKESVLKAEIKDFDLFQDDGQCLKARLGRICKTVARNINTGKCSPAFFVGQGLETAPPHIVLDGLRESDQNDATRRAIRAIESGRQPLLVWLGIGRKQGFVIIESPTAMFAIDLGE